VFVGNDPYADPLHEAAVLEGHRHLLATFRAFWDPEAFGPPSVEDVRGAVAFLRHGLLPFARWEEASVEPATPDAETTAFEHAFLAAEIDALAAAASRPHGASGSADAEVLRRLHRIDAVLELHVARAAERASTEVADRCLTADDGERAADDPPGGLRDLSPAEAASVLARGRWAMLATVDRGAPFAVPVAYAWDGARIYLASAPGRKLNSMQREPRVCVTVAEVRDGECWRSVVVEGLAERVHGLERARAIRLIQKQRGEARAPRTSTLRRLATARLVRISPTTVSGRARG
jgi:nitroimidazol reductase NimA-like FMN-containing flavoprotein (pyridoxamine 5'-phosphate oxidase superfamily)